MRDVYLQGQKKKKDSLVDKLWANLLDLVLVANFAHMCESLDEGNISIPGMATQEMALRLVLLLPQSKWGNE
jgi:hypothetical protein